MDPRVCANLNNGILMPLVGLGVYQTPPGPETENAVNWALQAGYRHIDTAAVYRNEKDVGNAIRNSGIDRREIFLTTKLARADHGYDSALRAFDASLKWLGLDRVDLYLIHWPGSPYRKDSWKALEKLYEDGRVRAIGVSNYTQRHLEELMNYCKVPPAVNQVEFNPFLYQKDLLTYCQTHNIQLEAYSPLTQGQRLRHPVVRRIADKHKRSPAQILLRWALEHKIVVIPKSVRKDRIQENFALFDFSLDADDMKTLDRLDEGLRTCWNPTTVP